MLRPFAASFLLASTLAACSGATDSSNGVSDNLAASATQAGPAIVGEFLTPSAAGEQPVIDAINEATSSIRMIMFHLTNPAVVTALVKAAGRGVSVEMILDQENLADHTPTSITSPLKAAGIKVTPSSTGFRITHAKSLVIDEKKALIMSLNLTMDFATTRDYALVTTDATVISEFLKLFAADLVNAANGTANTPTLSSPYLVVSPVNSEGRLTALVNSAKKTVIATSENIGDPDIQNAMIAAAKRGVEVRVIAPECDQNDNALYDIPFLAQLAAGGVEARAMPAPATATEPYMHGKMIIVDGTSAYVGSVNLSSASTTDAREIGLLFNDTTAIETIENVFEQDWSLAITPPPASSINCTAPSPTPAPTPVPTPEPSPSADAGKDAGDTKVDAAPTKTDAGDPKHDAAVSAADAGGAEPDAGTTTADAGGETEADSGSSCPGYASPTTASTCTGCGDKTCQENGCYGGYFCDEASEKCVAPSKVSCASN